MAPEWIKGVNFFQGTGSEPHRSSWQWDRLGFSVAGPPGKVRDPRGGDRPRCQGSASEEVHSEVPSGGMAENPRTLPSKRRNQLQMPTESRKHDATS